MKNGLGWYAFCSRGVGCLAISRNLLRNGEITKVRFEFLVASLVFGSEVLTWRCSIGSFQLGSSLDFWAKDTMCYDPFSRVGACGRRPSESADPGASASWGFYKRGIGLSRERSFTGAGGWGLLVDPRRPFWLRKRVVLRGENEGSGAHSRSGVSELELSLANWTTRLAEVT